MLSRRGFAGCALCAAVGLVATNVQAQTGGVTRTMLGTSDYPGNGKVSILMTVEIPPNAVIARHTHPGVESSVVMEGEVMLELDGQPARTYKAGEGFQVPPGVPHSGRGGPAASKLAATYIVEKDKPLASPA
ncbi:cupin domain-containing protein [Belnapia rosea]|uniref:Cupin domain-containing protein n=1 Tax=Belnapia rosea TaxID=938405 RepID=A0A1G6V091_9PROT|nr:cupin domain-containing protein [Belnapia rosea]SDB72361.1 Cupin domain-containing protein [Belnapia rosea]SDD46933.1 Cupin domain-containing protein [Belnapia rosea]